MMKIMMMIMMMMMMMTTWILPRTSALIGIFVIYSFSQDTNDIPKSINAKTAHL